MGLSAVALTWSLVGAFVAFATGIAAGLEIGLPVRRQRAAEPLLHRVDDALQGAADKAAAAVLIGDRQACGGDALGHDAVGDGFAVDQHAIAVEDDKSGKHGRSIADLPRDSDPFHRLRCAGRFCLSSWRIRAGLTAVHPFFEPLRPLATTNQRSR